MLSVQHWVMCRSVQCWNELALAVLWQSVCRNPLTETSRVREHDLSPEEMSTVTTHPSDLMFPPYSGLSLCWVEWGTESSGMNLGISRDTKPFFTEGRISNSRKPRTHYLESVCRSLPLCSKFPELMRWRHLLYSLWLWSTRFFLRLQSWSQ